MAEPYGWDTIEACEELYILDGLSFEQVAEKSGVAVATLKRWSGDSEPSWPERRREYRQAQVSVRRGVMLAKAKLIGSLVKSQVVILRTGCRTSMWEGPNQDKILVHFFV